MLDELNKYAPREGHSPIKEILLDVAERGRSLGIILIGAQQTASEVERRVIANSSPSGSPGRLDPAEADRPEYGFLPVGAPGPGDDRQAGHDVRLPTGDPRAAGRRVPLPGVGDAARRTQSATPAATPSRASLEAPPHERLARRQGAERRAAHRRAARRAWPRSSTSPPTRRSTLVLVAGDLFESRSPSPEAQRPGVADAPRAARLPVPRSCVIAGNHDNGHLLEALSPLAGAPAIHVLGRRKPPTRAA